MTSHQQQLQYAAEHLGKHDAILEPIIKRAGLATYEPHSDYYAELVSSIIGQQLSVKAAASIEKRFKELFAGQLPSPEQILDKSAEELRAVGFSRPKANYVQDLARHIIDGRLKFEKLDVLSNQEITDMLVDIKGIGEWTVHMFLIFCLGRLDVLPVGDLGIRNGVRQLYGFEDVPTPGQIIEIAATNNWHPYESVASWYVWQSLDNAP